MGSHYTSLKNIPDAEHVILYGSHVVSMAHAQSDVDLLVLTKLENQSKNVEDFVKNLGFMNANIFTYSKRSFLRSRSCDFYFSGPLEFAVRYGQEIKGRLDVKRQPDKEVVAQRWVMTLFLCSSWAKLSPTDAVKEFYRGTMLVWHLENLLEIEDIYSIGHFSHHLLNYGKERFEHDPLWAYMEHCGDHWKWLDLGLSKKPTHEVLANWALHLKLRLLKYDQQLINNLHFKTISSECLNSQQWCPLFHQVPWEVVEKDILRMKDHGQRFIFNFIKLCYGHSVV